MQNDNGSPFLKIDKSELIEKEIAISPSIFIEGAAACGKTTAVRLYLEHHPEIKSMFIPPEEGSNRIPLSDIDFSQRDTCFVLDDLPAALEETAVNEIVAVIHRLDPTSRMILISRYRPHLELLKLFWKEEMALISQKQLLFSIDEIYALVKSYNCYLNAGDLFRETGGWPGAVLSMIRLANLETDHKKTVRELRLSYEMNAYIQHEIVGELTKEERQLLTLVTTLPLFEAGLMEELSDLTPAVRDIQSMIESLTRKGMIQYIASKKNWRIAPLFQCFGGTELDLETVHFRAGTWYEQHGYIREALDCFASLDDSTSFKHCMRKHYSSISMIDPPYDVVLDWKVNEPFIIYLRGLYAIRQGKLDEFHTEMRRIETVIQDGPPDRSTYEIFLNLCWLDHRVSLDAWLEVLKRGGKQYGKLRIFQQLGGSSSYLSGLRDLSELFACSKKEVNRKAKIWKDYLGRYEWKCYEMAKTDYEIEIGRKKNITNEEWKILDANVLSDTRQMRLAHVYLLEKSGDEWVGSELLEQLRTSLLDEAGDVEQKKLELVEQLYHLRQGDLEKCLVWLSTVKRGHGIRIDESNWGDAFVRAAIYTKLHQNQYAKRILKELIPWLRLRQKQRILSEALFMQAVIYLEQKEAARSLTSSLESFAISSRYRYLKFYTQYGTLGRDVLINLQAWQQSNESDHYQRRKRYNYGDIVKMPVMDYLMTLVRAAKKAAKPLGGNKSSTSLDTPEEPLEKLTMTELLVLQEISDGQRNADICRKMNLKLSTVKSHIYNIYRKLGVENRVQAIRKGKELGLIKGEK